MDPLYRLSNLSSSRSTTTPHNTHTHVLELYVSFCAETERESVFEGYYNNTWATQSHYVQEKVIFSLFCFFFKAVSHDTSPNGQHNIHFYLFLTLRGSESILAVVDDF